MCVFINVCVDRYVICATLDYEEKNLNLYLPPCHKWIVSWLLYYKILHLLVYKSIRIKDNENWTNVLCSKR